MRRLLISCIIGLAVILNGCSSSNDEPNIQKEQYLSEIIVNEHEYKFGVADTYGDLYEKYLYDEKGNLLSKKTNYYNSTVDSRISGEYVYKYDSNNHMIESDVYTLSLLDYKYFYTYNSIDSISEMKEYDSDGALKETWTYEYDSNKKLVKATEVDNWLSGQVFGYIHNYSYTGKSVTINQIQLKDNSWFGTTLNEYDSHGNLTNNYWTNGETGKKTHQKEIVYEYDSKGRISKSTSWLMYPNDLTYRSYTYNDNGSIQKIHISYSYNTKESDLIYEYIYK